MKRRMVRKNQLGLGLLVFSLLVCCNVGVATPILISQDLGAGAYSASQASGDAPNAFDGDLVTVWNSGGPVVGTPTWIEVDLGQTYDIDHFKFCNTGADLVAIDLYVSDSPIGGQITDRENPPAGITRIAYYVNRDNVMSPRTLYSWNVGDFDGETLPVATTEGRYVQAKLYVFMAAGAHTWGHMNEFQVYGTAVPEPMTMVLLGAGGVAMFARRRRKV